jgi:hypothetical protein
MRQTLAGFAGLILAAAIAVPVAANSTDRFSFDDVIHREYSCGVLETTQVYGDGTAYFGTDGAWLSTAIRFRYDGLFTDPATGTTIGAKGRQILTEQAGSIALRGQGTFIRVPGQGVVNLDVGRLVFDLADGTTTFASAKVIRFDDPDASARVDGAVCSLFD